MYGMLAAYAYIKFEDHPSSISARTIPAVAKTQKTLLVRFVVNSSWIGEPSIHNK